MAIFYGVKVDASDGVTAKFRLTDMVPAGVLAVLGLTALAIGTLSAQSVTDQYLIVGAPWKGSAHAAEIVWRAGGAVAGFGGVTGIVIAVADIPDFADALRAEGAWLVIPSPTLFGCFSSTKESAT